MPSIARDNERSLLKEFVGGVVHDLKSPVTVIRALAQLGLRDAQSDQATAVFQKIVAQTDRLQELLAQLLSLLREAGDQVVERIAPVELIERVMAELEPLISERHIDVVIFWECDAEVTGLLGLLSRAFHNIIVNALDAMDCGGVLTLRSTRQDGELLITIQDTGPGIPPSIAEHVFSPYVSGRVGGTGLGLYTARKTIVDGHGGKLWFETEQGVGTTLFVQLPVAPSETLY